MAVTRSQSSAPSSQTPDTKNDQYKITTYGNDLWCVVHIKTGRELGSYRTQAEAVAARDAANSAFLTGVRQERERWTELKKEEKKEKEKQRWTITG